MIQLNIEGLQKMEETIKKMQETVHEFGRQHMPDELVFWQTEDMRRKRPNTETPDDKTAQTQIYQKPGFKPKARRRRKTKGRKVTLKSARRKLRSARPFKPKRARRSRSKGSKLPRIGGVLRQELFASLCERMLFAMKDKIKWLT